MRNCVLQSLCIWPEECYTKGDICISFCSTQCLVGTENDPLLSLDVAYPLGFVDFPQLIPWRGADERGRLIYLYFASHFFLCLAWCLNNALPRRDIANDISLLSAVCHSVVAHIPCYFALQKATVHTYGWGGFSPPPRLMKDDLRNMSVRCTV